MLKISLITLLLLSSLNIDAEENSAQQLYQTGIGLFQQKDWPASAEKFKEALSHEPENPYILYNLGLASVKTQELAWAIAYFRKALYLSPGLTDARTALKKSSEQLNIGQNNSSSTLKSIAQFIQTRIPLVLLVLFACITLGLFAGTLISHLGKRSHALSENTPSPNFNFLLIPYGIMVLIFTIPLVFKVASSNPAKATVIREKTFAKSGPEAEATDLFEISNGSEIYLQEIRLPWVKIQLPGGLTGWVQNTQIFQHSGDPKW